jgi:hypothetical protein
MQQWYITQVSVLVPSEFIDPTPQIIALGGRALKNFFLNFRGINMNG